MRKRPFIIWMSLAVLIVLAALPRVGTSQYVVTLMSLMFISGIAAMGLDILVGYGGMVSFAQGTFFGIAAYGVGVASTEMLWTNFYAIAGFSVLLSVALAAVTGLLALRARGVGFIIITLAINELVWGLAYQWTNVSGGDNGLIGFVRPILGSLNLTDTNTFYYFCLGVMAVCAAVLYLVVRSPYGLALRGIREQPRRMRALGYNTWLYQYIAFIVAALFAGIAGVLLAYYNQFVGTSMLNLAQSTQLLIMTIIGGTGTLWGALLGSGIIVTLSNFLSNYTMRWETILGIIYVATVMFAPDGLLGIAGRILMRIRGADAAAKGVMELRPEDDTAPGQEG